MRHEPVDNIPVSPTCCGLNAAARAWAVPGAKVHVAMDTGDQENAEEIAWQRLRQAILQCQAESAQSEANEPAQVIRTRVGLLSDELVDICERGERERRRLRA